MRKMTKPAFGIAVIACLVIVAVSPVIAAIPPAPAAPGSSFDQRLNQRKQERAIVLSTKDQTRLVGLCAPAQTKVRLLQNDIVPLLANRTKAYRQIDGKLWVTIGQLKLASRDTFKLEQERDVLADKVTIFQATSSSFTQTLDDILVINCKADVTGFQALVSTAQLYYAQLQSQSTDIRGYVVNTIKPEINSHITDLQPKNTTDKGN